MSDTQRLLTDTAERVFTDLCTRECAEAASAAVAVSTLKARSASATARCGPLGSSIAQR